MKYKFSLLVIVLIISSLLNGCLEEENVEIKFDLVLEVDEANSTKGFVKVPIQKKFDPTILNKKDPMGTFSYKYENTTHFMIMHFNNSVNINIDTEMNKDDDISLDYPLMVWSSNDGFGYHLDEEKLNVESKNITIDGYYAYLYLDNNNSVIFSYYFETFLVGGSTTEVIETRIYPGWNKVKCISDSEQP